MVIGETCLKGIEEFVQSQVQHLSIFIWDFRHISPIEGLINRTDGSFHVLVELRLKNEKAPDIPLLTLLGELPPVSCWL